MQPGMDAGVPHSQDEYTEEEPIRTSNNEVPASSSNSVPLKVFITVVTSLSTSSATVPGSTNGENNGSSSQSVIIDNLQPMENQRLGKSLGISIPAGTIVTVSHKDNQQPPPSYGNSQQQTNYPSAPPTTCPVPQLHSQQQQQQLQGKVNVLEVGQIEDPCAQRPVNDIQQAPQISNQEWNNSMYPIYQQFPSTSTQMFSAPGNNNMMTYQGPMRTQNMSSDFRFAPYPNFGGHVASPDDNETAANEEKKKTQERLNKNSATWNMRNTECLRYGVSLLSIMRQSIQYNIPYYVMDFFMKGDAKKEERLKTFSFPKATSKKNTSVNVCREKKRRCGQKVCELLGKFREYFCFKSVESVIMKIHEEEKEIMKYKTQGLKEYPTKDDFKGLEHYVPNYSLDSWVEFMAKQKNPQKLNQVNTVEYTL